MTAQTTTHPAPTVDVVDLEAKVKEMYRLVAEAPHGRYHFELGRPLAERLGKAQALDLHARLAVGDDPAGEPGEGGARTFRSSRGSGSGRNVGPVHGGRTMRSAP